MNGLKENVIVVENETALPEEKAEEKNNTIDSNGLENFNFDEEETPELFNSNFTESKDETFSSIKNERNEEEEDLEIPAFLRRQKN